MKRLAISRPFVTLALGAGFLFVGCGDDDDDGPQVFDASNVDAPLPIDAGQPDAAIDAAPPALGCAELDAPAATLSTYPAVFEGDLATANAGLDVTVPCALERAPFGVLAPGNDHVVKLTNLTPGTTYRALLETGTEGDMAVYVITGCSDGGPAEGQCLAFADQIAAGIEAGAFVAPESGVAYAVVDYWEEGAPSSTTFKLSVDAEGCLSDLTCPATAPMCSAALSNCLSYDQCTGDDRVESTSDDGPNGATEIVVTGGPVTIDANVCSNFDAQNDPERDYYKFTVVDGGAVDIAVSWVVDPNIDIDVQVFDAQLNSVGLTFYQNPEDISLTFLPAGTYYIAVNRFLPDNSSDVTPYTITVTPKPTALCTTNAQCGATFTKQNFRPVCNAQGACVALAGAGAVALGGICDTADDCVAEAALCTNFPFTDDPDTRSVCSPQCTADADCSAIPTAKCNVDAGFCQLPCTADNQCPVSFNATPAEGQPWSYATCDVETGLCAL